MLSLLTSTRRRQTAPIGSVSSHMKRKLLPELEVKSRGLRGMGIVRQLPSIPCHANERLDWIRPALFLSFRDIE